MKPIDPALHPLIALNQLLPAEALADGVAWTVWDYAERCELARSMSAYLEILGQGIAPRYARQFRDALGELRALGDSTASDGEPYEAWRGSIEPVLRLTVARGLEGYLRPAQVLLTIRWIVRSADISDVSDAWLGLAYAWEEDQFRGAGEEAHNTALLDYLRRMIQELGL